ncbi:Na+/H+ antiporter subunit A [Virgibacillus necropolis]|uniref:Na+/H+ antiporter subunit A n=1 Tax=Virgibacillus necropolis TaxID=163877 RepID=A0A221MB76_9BACI|nr:Na+/H+ antiporter subunit A [Virgibacillus necropolis]ASN04850.1 Na+/H+ antiporter subunit A [Virgibacillus necropolis]
MVFVLTTIIILCLAVALIQLRHKRNPTTVHIGWFILLVPATLFILLTSYIPQMANGKTLLFTMNWIPSYDINFTFYLDGLSIIFGLIITGIGALVTLYSIYYLSTNEALGRFYTYLLMFMASMLGVVFSDNMMVLYVFWELTSISSFLLIAFWYQRKKSRQGAQKAMLITITGGMSMLAGFLMLYGISGTFSIREIVSEIALYSDHDLFLPAMLLILLGAFTKSAQFPFHIWLPDAMEAPTPVSAYLHSATMVKAGIYLVARFTPVFGGEETWFWLVSGVGIVTLFWGSFQAVRQTDLKALLAYSTVSQLGMIMSMFGIGSVALHTDYSGESVLYTQAAFAALFHLVNHSTFKGALFMVVGIIDHRMGTRDIRRLGGLMALMPVTFTITCIGSFSMAGLPPFNGFLSKEMFFTAVLNISHFDVFSLETWGILFPVIAWTASVLTFVYCMIIVFKTFFGPYQMKKLEHPVHETPSGMLIAPGTLALFVIGIFFFPNLLGDYVLHPAMNSIFPTFPSSELTVHIAAFHGFNTELLMTFGIVIVGTLLYVFFRYWKGVYKLFPEKWSFNTLYNFILDQLEKTSNTVTNLYMTGYLRDYMTYIYLFFIIATGGALIYTKTFLFEITGNAPITIFEWIIAMVMMAAAIAILFAHSRLTAILLNSALGYGIAMFFVILRAPDLALTQTVIETVTTVLFLAAYYFLPEWKKENTTRKIKGINLLISVCVGIVFTVVALAVQNGKLFGAISGFYENAKELAGGKNIVNTILGDFRAFDTMLEVVVLLIAGIGVYSFTKLKAKKEEKQLED